MPDWRRYVRERLSLPRLRPEREAEIVEDLAQQLDDLYRAALHQGATESEAESAARREIVDWNSLAQDITRSDTRQRHSLDRRAIDRLEASPRPAVALFRIAAQCVADVLHGWRLLLQKPGFTAAVLVTLALGIGANTAVFTILDTVLLRPLPYSEPERLVRIWESNPARGWPQFGVSQPNFLDWREQGRGAFERLAASTSRPHNLTLGGETERLPGVAVTHDFLPLLGVRPTLGRNFLPDEDAPGRGNPVVLLSRGLWQHRFGGDPEIVGRAITLNDVPHTVIGVLPEFHWGRYDVFVPLRPDPNENRGDHRLSVYGRLKPGVSLDQAGTALAGVAAHLARQYPESNDGWTVTLNSFFDWAVPQESRRPLYLLLAAVALVLLIACANVAGLLLARAAGRRREIAVRAALGASRARLVRQLLAEAMLLALLGGGLGLLAAQWGLNVLKTAAETAVPRADEIALDHRVLLFALGTTVLTGLLFGLAPALQATRVDLQGALKDGATGDGRARQRARSVLVVGQVALSLVLLVGVGLLLRSLMALIDTPPGFDPRNLLTASINLPESRYPTAKEFAAFHQRLLQRLRGLPGIDAASIASGLPMDGNATMMEVHPDEAPAAPDGPAPSAQWRLVSPGYFRTMGIPLRAGRDLEERDLAPDTFDLRGAVISETMARRLWPGQDPIGRRFHPWNATNPPVTVVGVAGDVRLFTLDETPGPAVYFFFVRWNPIQIAVRTQGEPGAFAGLLRDEVRAIDPGVPVAQIRPMQELLGSTTSPRRFTMTLLAIFAGAALLLSGVGLFGLLAFLVAQRTRDIGVRLALGARRSDILRLVVGRAMHLTAIGVAAGLAGALALAGVIRSMLYGVGARDPLTLVATALLLVLVALLACWIPARRAARVDPIVALRCE
jgi:putative ABC transport system permease protein